MRALLLEAASGIAGDMTLGALFDLGVDKSAWCTEMAKLALPEPWELRVERQSRHGIVGNRVSFWMGGKSVDGPLFTDHHGHGYPEHPRKHGMHGRAYREIRSLIHQSALSPGIKERALRIFACIGEAEAKLHGVALDEVHFHEIGALDAILDIVGVAVALEHLGISKLYCLPLPIGSGTVQTAHGVLPLPAPATAEILKGFPVRRVDWPIELVTPTGAAIVVTLASSEVPREYRIERIGYGVGSKDFAALANVLRIFVIETGGLQRDEVAVLETAIDDSTPEWLATLADRLRAAGALDVYLSSIQMKKGRLGSLLTILARPQDAETLASLCFRESTTIGVRLRMERRIVLSRRISTVETAYGKVQVKIVELPDGSERAIPEHESVRSVAEATGMSFIEVYRAAEAAVRKPAGKLA